MQERVKELLAELRKQSKALQKKRETGLYTDKTLREERDKILATAREKLRRWKAEEIQKREKRIEEIKKRYAKKTEPNIEERKAFIRSLTDEDLELLADGIVRGEVKLTEMEKVLIGAELRDRAKRMLADHIAHTEIKQDWEQDPEYLKLEAELRDLADYSEDFITLKPDEFITVSYRLEDVLDGRDNPIQGVKAGATTKKVKEALRLAEEEGPKENGQ